MKENQSFPSLGIGMGYRAPLHEKIVKNKDDIDFLEIIAERYIYGSSKERANIDHVSELFPVIPHGVSLSVGSHAKPSMEHIRKIKKLTKHLHAPYFSEHLAVTRSPGIDLGHLSPICFNPSSLKAISENINIVQNELEIPIALENITYTHKISGSTIPEEIFFQELCAKTNCLLLLDLNNLYTNSVNWGYCPKESLNKLPLKSVCQVHLAGGHTNTNGKLVDSHSSPISQHVWSLLNLLLEKSNVNNIIIERDANFPPFEELLNEISTARTLQNRVSQRLIENL